MKRFIALSLSVLALTGCGSLRELGTTAALGAGGAALGNSLGGGDPLATAGGAAAGVAVAYGVNRYQDRRQLESFNQGYEQGRREAASTYYRMLRESHRLPAEFRGATNFTATTVVVRRPSY